MPGTYRPTLKPSDVPFYVQNIYGLRVNVLQELDSYDDQNFHVEVISDTPLPAKMSLKNPNGYVFKIFNTLDSTKPKVLETQVEIMHHSNRAGYPTTGPVPTLSGQFQEILCLPSSESQDIQENFVVCLLNYLPGPTLDQVTLTSHLCYEIGWFAGKLDVILQGFPVKENSVLLSMTRKWNISQVPKLREKVFALTCKDQQKTVEEVISQLEKAVLSSQSKFSKGLIHGDFNDCNILVSHDCSYLAMLKDICSSANVPPPGNENCKDNEQNMFSESYEDKTSKSVQLHKLDGQPWHVSGLLDFGDTTFSLYLFEVAVAIVHVMINKHSIPAMEAASFVLAGYLEHIKLTLGELSLLKLCICARFTQSLVLGYFSITQDPKNNYILTHANRVWPVFKCLWEMPDQQALKQFLEHVPKQLRFS